MVAAKLLTVKAFSEASLMSTMRSAWNTTRNIIFRPIRKNIFVVQAFCLGDWKRIMEEDHGFSAVLPHMVPTWVQIHKVPHLYRMESILKQLASKIGGLVTVEMRAIATDGGNFHRARCGTGEYTEENFQFGNWMIAVEEMWRLVTPRVHENIGVEREQPKEECGACPPRGRGRGQGGWGPYPRGGVWMEKKLGSDDGSGLRKRASEEAGLDKGSNVELSDTATILVEPMEEKHGMSREVLAKKQLSMTAELSKKVEIGVPPPPPPKYISSREEETKETHRE
uniref:Uncharacterized protein n=1 Tax=Setaria viridis TaxID=4556 RepID=A0A4U6W4Q8_SETVI|nr:hypothetical protein SEVIR_2G170800v2 [Setaria viridis]